MTRAHRPDYIAARKRLLGALESLVAKLECDVQLPYQFRFASQQQAGIAERAAYKDSADASGPGLSSITSAEWRAAVYNQADHAAELAAFVRVSKIAISELGRATLDEFKKATALVPLTLLRGLLERAANASQLSNALAHLPAALQRDQESMAAVLESAEATSRALRGTRLNWPKLAETDFRSTDAKAVQYVQRELRADLKARNVLGAIDSLNKRVPGTRVAYEVLCEFLHPNVGDLFAATLQAESRTDHHGTRLLVRTVGLGPKTLDGRQGELAVHAQLLDISGDVVLGIPALYFELEEVSQIVTSRTRWFVRAVLKRRQIPFRKDDPCPCLSGLVVRRCCGQSGKEA